MESLDRRTSELFISTKTKYHSSKDTLRMKGISLKSAIRRVVRKYKHKINNMFDEFSDDKRSSDIDDSESDIDDSEKEDSGSDED